MFCSVWRTILDLDKVVEDHHVAHSRVCSEFSDRSAFEICVEFGGIERGKEVSWMNNGCLSSYLTETKGCEETTFQSNVLYRFRGIEQVRERTQFIGNVVGVVISGDQGRSEGLHHAVELPGGRTSLGDDQ